MSNKATTTTTKTEPDAIATSGSAPAIEKDPDILFILDTTAQRNNPRTHDMMYQGQPVPFTFEAAKPLAVPFEVAIQFLKHTAFRLTDKDGNLKDYKAKPKQPHELGANERYRLSTDETIARLDELSTTSLMLRSLEVPNGEKFKHSTDRHAMIAFLTEARKAFLKTAPADSDIISADEGFTPEFDATDEAA